MTRVLVIGGGGMIGQKLAWRIARGGLPDVSSLTLFDIGFGAEGAPGTRIQGSLDDAGCRTTLAEARYDVIFHLAAVVSGEAEADFQKGWNINMFALWEFLDALRREHEASAGAYRPRLVFTSSLAVFGPPYPPQIGDDFLCAPQSSYGAQKAIGELMVAEHTRKGFIDGFSLRLPTICVRPGLPNKAASSFVSGIIREPLNGARAILPVPDETRNWLASPRAAAVFLTHAALIDTGQLAGRLSLNLPGLSCTVGDQIEALRRVAGQGAVDLIDREPDDTILRIVSGWPQSFDAARAKALGFVAETAFEQIIDAFLEDDYTGDRPSA